MNIYIYIYIHVATLFSTTVEGGVKLDSACRTSRVAPLLPVGGLSTRWSHWLGIGAIGLVD